MSCEYQVVITSGSLLMRLPRISSLNQAMRLALRLSVASKRMEVTMEVSVHSGYVASEHELI